jgi:hypothetical protein
MDNQINVLIDGRSVAVPAGTTILKAADMAGIRIPRLCFLENIMRKATAESVWSRSKDKKPETRLPDRGGRRHANRHR